MSRRSILAVLVAGLLAGCGGPDHGTAEPKRNVIVLEATGTATISTLTLEVDGKAGEEHSVPLPWSRTLEFAADSGPHTWKLVLRYVGGDVHATCTANGKLLTQTSGSGSAGTNNTAELSGSVKK